MRRPPSWINWSNWSSERTSELRVEVRFPDLEEVGTVLLDQLLGAASLSGIEPIRILLARVWREPPLGTFITLADVYVRWLGVLVAEEVEAETIFQQGLGSHRFPKIRELEPRQDRYASN